MLVGPIVGKIMQKMGMGAEAASRPGGAARADVRHVLTGTPHDRTLSAAGRPAPRGSGAGAAAARGGLLAASVLLHLRDPHQSGSWGYCPWLMLTGTYCPGCGGLRAVNDLTHGDVAGAASSNLLFVASLPAPVAVWWLRSMLDRWRGVYAAVTTAGSW